MLILRKTQLEILAEHSRQSFEDRLVQYLSQAVPLEFENTGEDRVRELIRGGMQRAEGYDIVDEIDVTHFVELMLAIEPEWEFAPHRQWACDILRDDDLTGHLKMELIYERIDS
jgi:hypothetical protein